MTQIQPLIPLSDDEEVAGLKKINYSRNQLMEDVKMLRSWLEEQHHLPSSRLKEDDFFLIRFLTGCKGSLEKSKKKIDAYYSTRSACQSIFSSFDPDDVLTEEVSKFVQSMIFPKSCPDSTRIYYARIVGPFAGTFTGVFRAMFQLFELAMRQPEISSSGYIAMTDLKGSSPDMLIHLSPSLARDVFYLIQEAYPFRMLKLVYVNASPAMEAATNYLVKPFLAEKLKQRLLVTSSGPEILKEWVPTEILPDDFGGSSPSLDSIYGSWRQLALTKRDLFKNEWSETIDDSKRPEGKKFSNPYFGLDGSIKKLCLD